MFRVVAPAWSMAICRRPDRRNAKVLNTILAFFQQGCCQFPILSICLDDAGIPHISWGRGEGVPRDENFKKDECVCMWMSGALGSQMQTKSVRVIRVFRDEKLKKDECGQRGALVFKRRGKKCTVKIRVWESRRFCSFRIFRLLHSTLPALIPFFKQSFGHREAIIAMDREFCIASNCCLNMCS
jgi:hypothetical protein